MKNTALTIIALLITMVLLSFNNKPEHIQRRKGILSVDSKGKTHFEPLEDWQDYTPKADTVYQYRVQ